MSQTNSYGYKNKKEPLEHIKDILNKTGIDAQQLIILIALISIMAVFSILSPVFFSVQNLGNILRVSSFYGIAALGMTLVILTGGIDLSVGSVLALGGAVGAGLLGVAFGAANPIKLPVAAAIIAALAVTGLIGLLNGFVITKLKMTPFIATLAMMTIARGLTYVFTDFIVQGVPGTPITFFHPVLTFLGTGAIAGIPTQAVIFLILALILSAFLRYTAFGRNVYAIGGNVEIARLAGISTDFTIITTYVMMGVLGGLSGIIFVGRLSSASPLGGTGYELDIITAVVLGGATLVGGRGTIFGTVLGVLIVGVINNGLDILNVPSFYQYLIKGTILVAAIVSDRIYHEKQNRKEAIRYEMHPEVSSATEG